ncbi:MAG: acetate/propionate family kinase [Gammaproteobacteria bacterium]|nr:acetate/propionate family kinase [Gammaproteobacteria bacterium]
MRLLTVNAGSSSLRLALYERKGGELVCLRQAHAEADGAEDTAPLERLLDAAPGRIDAIAHRIVHGGRRSQSCRIDAAVEREIEACAPLAPLHNPPALRWIAHCRRRFGADTAQVAVFDTAFYADLPPVASTYALPHELAREHGLRRYGFHGSAHAAMVRRWRALRPDLPLGGRVISLQLGAGCSVTATAQGRAVDTSMGFTPLEGLMMATRPGDIDPGLLIHLQRRAGLGVDALEDLLTHRSGLRGVSGLSGDMRELLASREPRAELAVGMFCYRARKYVGAYLAALGGADAVLFGGGIGEHNPRIRSGILDGLEHLGILLDPVRNESATGTEARISADASRIEVRVMTVDEGRVLAEEAENILNTGLKTKD